jgi:hypothetical protein
MAALSHRKPAFVAISCDRWRKLHNEELRNMYSSPNINKAIITKTMSRMGHGAVMGNRKTYTLFGWKNLRERDPSET